MADNWHVGNATDEADEHRGWLLGHFMAEPGDPSIRATKALEVKWGIHPAGQERPGWTSGDDRTTMVIPGQRALLCEPYRWQSLAGASRRLCSLGAWHRPLVESRG